MEEPRQKEIKVEKLREPSHNREPSHTENQDRTAIQQNYKLRAGEGELSCCIPRDHNQDRRAAQQETKETAMVRVRQS
jgi:hypothetical protein